jgi:hypothetical protein
VPALVPLAWGASGGVDYFGHAGGALAGAATGMVICLMWSADSIRPNHARLAGILALVGFAGSLFGGGIVATRYSAYAAEARQFVRLAEIPKDMRAGPRSADLVARYPRDPIAHLLRAVYFVDTRRLGDAEDELRAAVALASADRAAGAIRARAQAILAALLMEQGRQAEAKALAAETCRARESDPMRQILTKARLCG